MAEMKYNVPNNQWPEHPERATQEGKTNSQDFGLSLVERLFYSHLYSQRI